MKKLNHYPVTDYNKFPQKYYFLSIVKEIINIARLRKTKKIILDFGCGKKIFSKYLPNKKILNYDINPSFSEIKNYKNYKFDLVIFNHVLMYLKPKKINNLLNEMKKKNPKCEIIMSLSRQNFLSKIAMVLTLNLKAHDKTNSTYLEQIEQLNDKVKIIKKKLRIFGITDIYYCKFK
tara:strand:- start:1652 stop:2182 length:531 start_codon:yes stop_codon:yes gene_type:complete